MASENGVYQQRRRPTVWYPRTVRFRYHTLNPLTLSPGNISSPHPSTSAAPHNFGISRPLSQPATTTFHSRTSATPTIPSLPLSNHTPCSPTPKSGRTSTICFAFQNAQGRDLWMYAFFHRSRCCFNLVTQVEDPRLDCAVLRPMKTEHDSFLAYYLTQDDDSATKFKETRFGLQPYEVPEDQEVCLFLQVHESQLINLLM